MKKKTKIQQPESNPSEEKAELTPEQIKLKRKNNIIRIIKFVLFSASAGLIQIASFTLLNEVAKLLYWPAYLISLVLSVIWNFTFNRKFTFKSANNVPIAMLKVAIYYAVFTPLSTWGGNALKNIGWNEYLVLAISMVLNLVTEFLYNQYVVYRKSMNTNDLGKKEEAKMAEAGNVNDENAPESEVVEPTENSSVKSDEPKEDASETNTGASDSAKEAAKEPESADSEKE